MFAAINAPRLLDLICSIEVRANAFPASYDKNILLTN